MQFQVDSDNELILVTQEGPRLKVISYDALSDSYTVEILDVMFDLRINGGFVNSVRVPDDADNDQAAQLIATDYQDLIYAACVKYKELVVDSHDPS